MNVILSEVKRELERLEKILKSIDRFKQHEPNGCLKYQKRGKKFHYYQQYKNESTGEWERKYIKRDNCSLVRELAQKHYFTELEPVLKRQVKVLRELLNSFRPEELAQVYEDLSDIRKALVVPCVVSKKELVHNWLEETYEGNPVHPENLKYRTEQGEMVRSKSEMIIANILYQHRENIRYKYECPLQLMADGTEKTIYPDFTIMNFHTGKICYFEHAGRMDDPYYASEFVKKMNLYIANDLLPGRDVVMTFETLASPLDVLVIRKVVQGIVGDER